MIDYSKVIKRWSRNIGNERDIENPNIIDFVKEKKPQSLLDVGAHYSWYYYAPEIRKHVAKYHGVDILGDEKTQAIVDHYYTSNVTDLFFPFSQKYELVMCLSSIEHAGISTYKGDFRVERYKVFEKCLELSNKYVWFSFPVGEEAVDEGQFANITRKDMDQFEKIAHMREWKINERFFYSDLPSQQDWTEHTDREFALSFPYDPGKGVRSVCIMEIQKI